MMAALRKIGVGNDADMLLDCIKTHSDLKAASVRVFFEGVPTWIGVSSF